MSGNKISQTNRRSFVDRDTRASKVNISSSIKCIVSPVCFVVGVVVAIAVTRLQERCGASNDEELRSPGLSYNTAPPIRSSLEVDNANDWCRTTEINCRLRDNATDAKAICENSRTLCDDG